MQCLLINVLASNTTCNANSVMQDTVEIPVLDATTVRFIAKVNQLLLEISVCFNIPVTKYHMLQY